MIIGVNNLAKELKVSRITVYQYMKRGMPCYKLSEKKTAFDLKEIYKWLKTAPNKANINN